MGKYVQSFTSAHGNNKWQYLIVFYRSECKTHINLKLISII